jgi:hypothetical protein
MKKLFFALGFLVPIAIGMLSCNEVDKLDKQLYDSSETNVPVTKLDQLEQLDKQDAAADSSKVEEPKK